MAPVCTQCVTGSRMWQVPRHICLHGPHGMCDDPSAQVIKDRVAVAWQCIRDVAAPLSELLTSDDPSSCSDSGEDDEVEIVWAKAGLAI